MTDLTASDGTLFEPHLNGLNHRKIQMWQLNLFELIQTPSAAAAAARRKGPVAFCRKFRTFCKFCNFLGDRRRFARDIDMQSRPL